MTESGQAHPGDSGQAVRRFSGRVADYIRYRPGYPPAILDLLAAECQLTPRSLIADIGVGTGLLARLFLRNGNRVFGIEPNLEMRRAGEKLLADYAGFVSVAARAEATTLPRHSVDIVTAGQSFHWFDPPAAWREFARILKPAGWVALVWNERQTDTTPFLAAYEQLLLTFATDYEVVDHRQVGAEQLRALFGAAMRVRSFENQQVFDFEGVRGRLLSSSYAPLAGEPGHEAMLSALRAIFEAHQENGQIGFRYTTWVYYGPILDP